MQREQIVGLDLVRFLASLAVAMYHLGGCTWLLPASTPIRMVVGSDVGFPAFSWMYHGWIGVEVFFVISGVVIAYSAQRASAYKFAVGRIVRMAPALWICATVTACIVALSGQSGVLLRYLKSMTFFPAGEYIDPSHWTLAIEISFYIIVLFLIAVGRRNWMLPVITLLGLVSALGWLADFLGILSMPVNRTAALLLLPHGVFFAIGVLLHDMKSNGLRQTSLPTFFALCVAGIFEIVHQSAMLQARILYPQYQAAPMVPVLFWVFCLALIAGSLACNRMLSSSLRLNRVFRRLGLATYPLYLLNAIGGAYMLGLYVRAGLSQSTSLFLALATCIAMAVIVAEYIEPWLQARLRTVLDRLWSKWAATAATPA